MVSLLAYKVALFVLLAGIPTSVGTSIYYGQQQDTILNSHISDLSSKLDNANAQVSNLNSQVSTIGNSLGSQSSQISHIQSQNAQLQAQVTQLQAQLLTLSKQKQATATQISSGTIEVPNPGYDYVSFNVSFGVVASLNVTASSGQLSSYYPFIMYLLNGTQYSLFLSGNYGHTTWASMPVYSLTTEVSIPYPGKWYFAFHGEYPTGGISVTETLTLLESPVGQLNSQTSPIASGAINLSGYGAVQYVPFAVPTGIISSSLNLSFSVGGGYGARLAVLDQAQYNVFLTCNCVFYGNYTTTSWLSPIVQSYTAPVTVPHPGNWYLAFMEPPGTGSGFTLTETVKLTVSF